MVFGESKVFEAISEPTFGIFSGLVMQVLGSGDARNAICIVCISSP